MFDIQRVRYETYLLLSSAWHRRTFEIFTYACHAQKFLAQLILYATTKYSRIPFSDADCYQAAISTGGYLTLKMYLHAQFATDYFLPFQTGTAASGKYMLSCTPEAKNMSQCVFRVSEINLYIRRAHTT